MEDGMNLEMAGVKTNVNPGDDMSRYEAFLTALENRIIERREITRKGLDKEIGCTKGYVGVVLRKTRRAGPAMQKKIAEYFCGSLDEFIAEGMRVISGREAKEAPALTEVVDPHFETWTLDMISDLSNAEFQIMVSDYITKVPALFHQYGQVVAERLKVVYDDRKRILKERDRHRAILEAMSDAVRVNDIDKNIVYSNKAYRKLAGPNLKSFFNPEGCENSESCYIDEVLRTGETLHRIIKFNDRYYGISAVPLTGRDGRVKEVVSTIRDITEAHIRALNGETI